MATVVNARDVQIQSQLPRVATVTMQPNLTLSQDQVTGLGIVVAGTKMVFLQASTQVFQIAKSGTVSPSSTTLTAIVKNLTATPSLSVVSGTISPAPTLVGGTVSINASAMSTDTATIRLTVVESGVTYTDDMTIVKVREGTDGLMGFLTNENCTITADFSGNPLSYAGASGTFKVFQGTTDVTSLCTFALLSGGNPSGLTFSIGATTGVYSVTGGYPSGTDLTTLTFRATFGTSTLDKILTIGKQKAPTPSKTLVLGADKQVFTYNASGTAYPPSQTVTLVAAGQNLSGNPSWTCTLYDSSNTSLGAGTLGGLSTASTRTFDLAAIGSAVYAKITVTWDSLSDTTTVVKLQDGSAGISPVTGFLTNESMVVAADASGTVSSFTGSGGTFKLYDGTTDKTGNVAVTYSVQSSTGVTISIASTGIYTITAMSADSGTATLRAVYNGVTVDKVYAIAKSKAGAGGVTNIVGFLTNEATVVPTAFDGTGGSFTSAGGTFKVYDGITDKTGNVAVTYSVAASSGVTISIASTGIYSVTAMSADAGSATLRAVYGGVTIDKLYSIAKSKAGTNGSNGGAGAAAQTLVLTATAQTITYDKTGALSPSSQTISFTANLQNVAGTATFVATPYTSSNVAGTPITMGGSGNTRTLTGAQFNAAGTTAYVIVTATLSGLSDTMTVVKLKDGADGTPGTPGGPGAAGQRGSRTWFVALTGTTSIYSNTLATTTASADSGPVLNDTVTQYNNSQGFSETRFWNGTTWVVVNAVVDGSLLVSGTVGASAISVTDLSAIQASLGTVTINSTGYLRSNGATAFMTGAGFWMGYNTTTYKFRVGNPAGNYMSWDGTSLQISGNLNAATGTFVGALSGATGTFSGNLTAGGTTVGLLPAASGWSGLVTNGSGKGFWFDNIPGIVMAVSANYNDGLGHTGPYTLAEFYGSSSSFIRWGYYSPTGESKLEIMSPMFHLGGSSNAVDINGRFVVDYSGNVIADTIDIRRRAVLQSGTATVTMTATGTNQVWFSSGDDTGSYQPVLLAPGATIVYDLPDLYFTDVYDTNSLNGSYNQPFFVQCWPVDGAVSNWSGTSGTQFDLHYSAQAAPVRAFSNTGGFTNDGRVAFKVQVTLTLLSGGFFHFKLPNFNWAVYKL